MNPNSGRHFTVSIYLRLKTNDHLFAVKVLSLENDTLAVQFPYACSVIEVPKTVENTYPGRPYPWEGLACKSRCRSVTHPSSFH